jgi:hypothetical protein
VIEDIHPNSKLGQARSMLEAVRGQIQPIEEQLKAHKTERLQKQTLVERATLDTPPIEVAMAESRLRLLSKAIARETNELTPLVQQLQAAERELSQMESALADKLLWLPDLQDALVMDVQTMSVARWMEQLRDVRNQLQALIEAPGGARYEPVVTVSFRRLEPGEALPTVRHSAWEQRRQASIEQIRDMGRSIVAGREGFTHEPVIGLGREGGAT